MVKVNVTAGDTTIPAPTLAAGAYIKNTDNGTASAAMFMVLAQTNGVYPEGTKVEWADPAKVQKDAQTAGTYDEEVILDFPDGTKSKAFNVPGVLVVAAKQTLSTDPTTPTEANHTLTVHYFETIGYAADGREINKEVGSQTFTGKQGDVISTDQIKVPAGYKLAMDGVTYTIGDKDSTLEQPVVSIETPTDDHNNENQPTTGNQTNGQLPAGVKVVNGQVVDANGNVLAGWTVVNGQAVRNGSTVAVNADGQVAASAKHLPQTGSNDSLALAGLGAASLLGMFGLAGLNKKRG